MKLPSLPEGEITAIEVHRANPYVELGISIVGGNETPLINIVIQEVYRDGVIARDGRLLAGDQILQVGLGHFELQHFSNGGVNYHLFSSALLKETDTNSK